LFDAIFICNCLCARLKNIAFIMIQTPIEYLSQKEAA
jgi:hypothetical protein